MNADERLVLIRAKVARANKHIQELDAALVAFFKTNPYVVQGKHDPDTGRPVYKMTKVDPVSVAVPVIAGDVLQNLRSALDYLAYQLVSVGTGSSGPFDYVYFPIAASAAKYESDKRGKLK